MLLNDLSQADKRLAYLLGLSIQGYRGRGLSRRAIRRVILGASGFLLLFLWTMLARH